MTDPHDAPSIPDGFRRVPSGAWPSALSKALEALNPSVAVPRLRDYYDQDGDYAGRTFTEALPVDHDDFHASDLFVLSLLGVPVTSPRAARRFLDPGPDRNQLVSALAAVDPTVDIQLADNETLLAMMELYELVKRTLGADPWVTASKLCARKRPRTFPVRDTVVQWWLGLDGYRSYTIEWQIYAELMRTQEVQDRLAEIANGVLDATPDPYELRHLDVALWMHARELYPRRQVTRRR